MDAVCAAAGIHTSKLKVVGLYEGSTVVQMFVEGSSPEAGNSDNAEELTEIVILIGQEAENGNLDEINGWTVLDLQITECFGSLEEAESYSIYELPIKALQQQQQQQLLLQLPPQLKRRKLLRKKVSSSLQTN